MNLWDSVSVALEGLAANKMRSFLTMLGVIIGVSAVITMLALAGGARQQMMSRIQDMGTNVMFIFAGQSRRGAVMGGAGSSQSLTLEDAEAIKDKCPSVMDVSPEVGASAQVKYRNTNTNTSITGAVPAFQSVRNYTIQEGKFFSEKDVKSLRKVAVIGPTTAKNLFGEASPVGKYIKINSIRFKVIGVTKVKGSAGGFGDPDDQLIIPITTAMRRVFGIDNIRSVSVQAQSMALMDQATKEVTELLRKRHRIREGDEDDFVIRSQAEVMQFANQASGIMTMLLAGIASVSLLVGGIGIMNIMLVSVTERTREIGIRMALGARGRDIQRQFLVEAMVISLVGGSIGVAFGMMGSWLISSISQWEAPVSLPSVILAFGFAAFVGIFFGFYPATKAARLNPIDALRFE